MWLRRLLWADGGTLALALETKGRGCWPRTMAASVCLFVCVSVTRLREPRLPCIADVWVLLVASQRHRRSGIVAQRCDDDGRRDGSPVQPELRRALSDRGVRQRSPAGHAGGREPACILGCVLELILLSSSGWARWLASGARRRPSGLGRRRRTAGGGRHRAPDGRPGRRPRRGRRRAVD